MSLRELARKHLETIAKPMLPQRASPRDVPAGQNASTPYSSEGSAVPAWQYSGTTQSVSLGQRREVSQLLHRAMKSIVAAVARWA